MANDCPKCEDGLPPWLATFADLMSLLMCFFVLLLSFATVDAVRFKKMAESMKDAFGVQRQIPANQIVMGVSVIKQEWSPSVAEQSVITEIRQETSPEQKEHLQMQDAQDEQAKEKEQDQQEFDRQAAIEAAEANLQNELAEQLADLQDALDQEVQEGLVTLERKESSIIVRIQEKGSFGSGSARLDPEFHEVMARISKVLAAKPGKITVAGHSDNIPISTGRFRSNWELSSARAVTVLHSMLRNEDISEDRVVVEGFADTRPLVENNSPQNRAKNRRVELILTRGLDDEIRDLKDLQLE
jgi:chemotaxis protein MotB